jgi:type VI secretion system ImpC/EvpB family protein
VQLPRRYDRQAATASAAASARLQHILCVCRFAHYVKVIMRDKTGGFTDAGEVEALLHNWLMSYTSSADGVAGDERARYPLRAAHVEVQERPDRPGSYRCVLRLQPHFQLEQVTAEVRLVTEVGR